MTMALRRWNRNVAAAWAVFCLLATAAGSSDDFSSAKAGSSIPLIDIGPVVNASADKSEKVEVARQIGQACEEIGFFAVINHGVDENVIEEAWDVTKKFFDLPLEEKQLSSSTNDVEYPYGYEQSEALSKGKAREELPTGSAVSPPDLKETYAIGPNNTASGMPPRRFPPRPAGMKEAYENYYSAMEELANVLLQAFAMALDLPENWFEDKMSHHMCALRTLNYPAIGDTLGGDTKPLPGQLRAGAHTDYGALTILKSGGPGLQLTKDSSIQQDWVDVPYLPEAFVINIGDLMQRWTNDKWVSTLHRVVIPPQNNAENRRQSMAFFVNINGDAEVLPIETCVDHDNPPKYGSITAREHLMSKHLASMGIETDELKHEL